MRTKLAAPVERVKLGRATRSSKGLSLVKARPLGLEIAILQAKIDIWRDGGRDACDQLIGGPAVTLAKGLHPSTANAAAAVDRNAAEVIAQKAVDHAGQDSRPVAKGIEVV